MFSAAQVEGSLCYEIKMKAWGKIDAMKLNSDLRKLSSVLFVLIFLAGCGTPQTVTPTNTQVSSSETSLPLPSIAAPEVTPTPPAAAETEAEVILWAPPSGDQVLAQTINASLRDLAATRKLEFEQRESLSAQELGAQTRLIVTTASVSEISQLAQVAPGVNFLAVNVRDLTEGGNIAVLQSGSASAEQLAFIAGYVLALVTPDYRVGVISQANNVEGARTRDGFATGARYYCGLCNAHYAPVIYYPLTAEVNDPANSGEWQTAVDALVAKAVNSIYVQPEISSPELITYLVSKGVRLMGVEGQAGLSEGAGAWVAILASDPGAQVAQAAGRLLDGESVSTVTAGIELTQADANLLTEGKLAFFERVEQDLLNGLISPLPYSQ